MFFYQDGVLNASKHVSFPSDEASLSQHWVSLSTTYNLPLYLCISAAQKRGLSDDILLADSNREYSNIHAQFIVSGLGELVELTNKAQQVVQL